MTSRQSKKSNPFALMLKHLKLANPRYPHFLKSAKFRYTILILLVLFITSFTTLYFFILKDIPSPQKLQSNPYPVSTKIFDRNGKLLYEIYAEQNRTPITLTELPTYIKQATIAIEDKNFYEHQGFVLSSLTRATINNIKFTYCQLPFTNCQVNLQGASTITQQLVKNALLTPERTFQRKIKEFLLTLAVETLYTKDQILEMYLNQIPYGGTSYGLEAASQVYFAKNARDLTLAEASILAGLPVAPSRYSPFGSNPQAYKQRQQAVLRRMLEDQYISQEQLDEAINQTITFNSNRQIIKAPHFVLWVKDQLIEEYGSQLVETGGLRVITTLDLNIQEIAQATVSAEIAKLKSNNISNGGAIVTNPINGEILSMVGSINYFDTSIDGNVNITTSYRQPGSSIKPINYLLAFTQYQLSPANIIADIPTCFQTPGQPLYCPQNYDNSFHGPVSLRASLANSYNIPAVKLLTFNSIDSFISISQALGITGWNDQSRFGLSLTLGAGEVRMIDLAQAYSTIANLGVKVPFNPILEVTDYKGQVYLKRKCQTPEPNLLTQADIEIGFSTDCQATRVILPQPAFLTDHILKDQNARNPTFGSSLNISNRKDVAVKTGTTNNLHDNWTIGYTNTRLTAVWVGNNDNQPMSRLVSGTTGAAPIWKNIMNIITKDQPQTTHAPPEEIVGMNVCSLTGSLPEADCPQTFDFFFESNQPQQSLGLIREWPIDKTTQSPFKPETPQENLEMQIRPITFDILGDPICIDCPYQLQSSIIKYPQL